MPVFATRLVPVLLTTAMLVAVGAPAEARDEKYAVPARVAEADLELRLSRADDVVPWAGSLPKTQLSVRNRSDGRTHFVAIPGDGSDDGRREPKLTWELERQGADGDWSAVARGVVGRCGNFDWDWTRSVARLPPGSEHTVEHYGGPLGQLYDLARPGRLRLRATYAFRRQGVGHGQPAAAGAATDELGKMEGYAPFELQSEWLEFDLVAPLAVRIARIQTLPYRGQHAVNEILPIRLQSLSDVPLVLDPKLCEVHLSSKTESERATVWLSMEPVTEGDPVTLEPGAVLPLFGEGGLLPAALLGTTGRRPPEGEDDIARVTVTLRVRGERPFRVRSDTVRLRVKRGE